MVLAPPSNPMMPLLLLSVTNRFPALSNAMPRALFNPVFAKPDPTPLGVNFSIVSFEAFAT